MRDVGDSPSLNRHLRFGPSLDLCYDVYAQPCKCRHCPTIDELDRMPQHHAVSPLTAVTSVKTAYRRGMNAFSLNSHGFLIGGISVVRNIYSMKVRAGDTPDVTAIWNIDYHMRTHLRSSNI